MKKAAFSTSRPSRIRAAASGSDSGAARAFRAIADDYLNQTCERLPEFASRLGLKRFEPRLSTNTPEEHAAQGRLAAKTLQSVEALPDSAFSGDDWLDRRGFLSMLRTHQIFEQRLLRWRNNPETHAGAAIDAVFDLMVRNADDLRPVLPAIEARLASLPDYLEAASECVKRPVPLWRRLAERTCKGGCEFLGGIAAELEGAGGDPARITSLIEGAKRAFARYASAVARKPAGPAGGFSVGRETFEFLVRERLGIDRSLPELEAGGRFLIEKLRADLSAEARRLGSRNANAVIEAARNEWTPSEPLLGAYRRATEAIKKRVIELDLVCVPPGESLKVLPVPPFMRHQFPTAAYNPPPPFSSKQQGIFWVNDLSLLQSDPAKKLREARQHFGLELTAAHEAYPGHHLQFAVQNRHPSKLRRLFSHAIFYEGWTLWCEKMCVDRGLVDVPGVKLMQIHDALWRAYRIIIDCGLHGGQLTFNGACKILMDGVGFTMARAQGDVNWYTSAPTVPMSYLLGRIEVERLHRHFVEQQGWPLRQFNDWMLSHGALPWSWIMEARRFRGGSG